MRALLLAVVVPTLAAQSLTPPVGDEFTIVWTGDPHYGSTGGTSEFGLIPMATWVAAHKTDWNIKAFVSVGDNECRAQANQTATDACFIAVNGYAPLTTFATALDNAAVPYVIIPGNHDCTQGATGLHSVWNTISLPRTNFAWASVFPAGTQQNQYLKVDSGSVHLGILGLTSNDTAGTDSDCETPDLTTSYTVLSSSWAAGVATLTLPRYFGILPGDSIALSGSSIAAYNGTFTVSTAAPATNVTVPLAGSGIAACFSNCGTVTTSGTALRRWAQGFIDAEPTRQFVMVQHQNPTQGMPDVAISGTAAGPFSIVAGTNDALNVTVTYTSNALSWAATSGGQATVGISAYQELGTGQTVSVNVTGPCAAYNTPGATIISTTTSSITFTMGSNPGTCAGGPYGTVTTAPIHITLTPGTRTVAQVVTDIGAALGALVRVVAHPLSNTVRMFGTSAAEQIALNATANSAYATLGLSAGQTGIVDRVSTLNWSVYGGYTPCQTETANCSRDGVGTWNGFIYPNPRLLWTLNGHDQSLPSIYAAKNVSGATVVMPMGAEGGNGNLFLVKFQPSLHQTTWYYVDVSTGTAAFNATAWYTDINGVSQKSAVFPWTPIHLAPSSLIRGPVSIRGGSIH